MSISGAMPMWRVGQNDVRSWIYEQFCGNRGLASWHTLAIDAQPAAWPTAGQIF